MKENGEGEVNSADTDVMQPDKSSKQGRIPFGWMRKMRSDLLDWKVFSYRSGEAILSGKASPYVRNEGFRDHADKEPHALGFLGSFFESGGNQMKWSYH